MIDNGLYVDKQTVRKTSLQQFAVGVIASPIAQGSAKRVRITFINAGTDQAFVRPSPPNSSTTQIILPAAGGIITLDYETHGSLLQAPWVGGAVNTNSNISVLDTVEQ